MTSKRVFRFKCDFCGKKNYSAPHMARHERHCTKNPNRECRVCKLIENEQKPIRDLIAVLPDIRGFNLNAGDNIDMLGDVDVERLSAEIGKSLGDLRGLAGGCPACMMAAFRQAGIPLWTATGFNYRDEMQSILDSLKGQE